MYDYQPQSPDEQYQTFRKSMGWLSLFMRAGAISVEVFLRGGFGSRYIGLQALLAIPLILAWSNFWPHEDYRPLVWFVQAYLGMLVCARLGVMSRRGSAESHSQYSGKPRLAWLFFWLQESTIKRIAEPMVAFTVGILLLPLSEPLGSYVMFAAACVFFSVGVDHIWQEKRAQDLNDIVFESEAMVRRFRDMRGR